MKFSLNIDLDHSGRVKVQNDLSLKNHPEVFVAGDIASVEIAPGKFLPGLAPAAMQAGKHIGKLIMREIHHHEREIFHYHDKGLMATIGKNKAVMEFQNIRVNGFIAWIAWLFVHIFYLIGFKNRVSVIANWVWSYAFSKRGSRLITKRDLI